MLNFDYKERLDLDELNEKINNVNNFFKSKNPLNIFSF